MTLTLTPMVWLFICAVVGAACFYAGVTLAGRRADKRFIAIHEDYNRRMIDAYREGEQYGAQMAWRDKAGLPPAMPDAKVTGSASKRMAENHDSSKRRDWQPQAKQPRA